MSSLAQSLRDTAAAFKSTAEVYEGAEKDADLPAAFHEVAKVLPPAQSVVDSIQAQVSKRRAAKEKKEEQEAADRVHASATRLHEIFNQVVPPGDGGPRLARYRGAAAGRGRGGGGRVEVLMKRALEGIATLTKSCAVDREQAAAVEQALQAVSQIPPSLEEEDDGARAFHNHGSGLQSIHLGQGDQNINTGPAPQFNGKFMSKFDLPKWS
ncbi:hypothetical protein GGR56DRAFT_553450 [Xylariaceae sp. FL0804]|nr:hypothetical protein GGR56DRAFT_553450 [Xylariaceae sp. FL0804]